MSEAPPLALTPEIAAYLRQEAERGNVSESDVVMFALGLLSHYRHETKQGGALVLLPVHNAGADGISFYSRTLTTEEWLALPAPRGTASALISTDHLHGPNSDDPQPPRLRLV